MKTTKACISIIVALAAVTILFACGGGGGGGGGTGNLPVITYSIMGIVSGAPQGTTVTLSGDAGTTTTTNSIGYYQFTGLSNGTYTVTPSMTGYTFSSASIPVTISNANAPNKDFTVINTYGIAGSVKLANSTSVSGVTITLVNSSGTSTTTTITDTNGNYSALGLAAGTYTISAAKGGYAMNPLNQKSTVTCDVRTGVDFTATAAANTYSIMGTVGVGGKALTLSGSNSGVIYTSASGTYSYSGLLAGSYTITPSSASIAAQTCTPPIALSNSDLTCDFVLNGLGFTPMPPPACLILSGTISGAVSSGMTVTVTYFRTLSPSVRTTTSDGSGNYLVSIPSSTYVVTPSMSGYTFSPPRICGAVSLCNAGSPTDIPGNNFTSQ